MIRVRLIPSIDIDGYTLNITRKDEEGYFRLRPLAAPEWEPHKPFQRIDDPAMMLPKDIAHDVLPQFVRECLELGIVSGLDRENEIRALKDHIVYLQETINSLIKKVGP